MKMVTTQPFRIKKYQNKEKCDKIELVRQKSYSSDSVKMFWNL